MAKCTSDFINTVSVQRGHDTFSSSIKVRNYQEKLSNAFPPFQLASNAELCVMGKYPIIPPGRVSAWNV